MGHAGLFRVTGLVTLAASRSSDCGRMTGSGEVVIFGLKPAVIQPSGKPPGVVWLGYTCRVTTRISAIFKAV